MQRNLSLYLKLTTNLLKTFNIHIPTRAIHFNDFNDFNDKR